MIGLIGTKIGMTQVFDEAGVLTPVSVIKIEKNLVVAQRTVEINGYSAVLLGSVDKKKSRIRKPFAGQFKEGVTPKKYMAEIRDFDKECKVGDAFSVELFEGIRYIDITGLTKGRGFQGVMKRHGFHGGPGAHGSKFHREPGSTGNSTTPAKSWKGIKQPGRMGHEQQTIQNLKVVKIDAEKNVLLVKGAVPGSKETVLIVKPAVKKNI